MNKVKVAGTTKTKQRKLAKNLSVKIKNNVSKISVEQEAVNAGYSPSYAKTHRFKHNKTWPELMDQYLPEELLAKKHSELLASADIGHYIFPPIKTEEEEPEENLEAQPNGGALKRKKKKKTKTKYGLTHEQIKEIVESVPGCRLIYIKEDRWLGQVAFFQQPDNKSQKDALDMAYKLRGNFAAEKHAIFATGLENLSDEDLETALQDKDFLFARFKKYGQENNDGGNAAGSGGDKQVKNTSTKANVSRKNTVKKELKTMAKKRKQKSISAKR